MPSRAKDERGASLAYVPGGTEMLKPTGTAILVKAGTFTFTGTTMSRPAAPSVFLSGSFALGCNLTTSKNSFPDPGRDNTHAGSVDEGGVHSSQRGIDDSDATAGGAEDESPVTSAAAAEDNRIPGFRVFCFPKTIDSKYESRYGSRLQHLQQYLQ